MKRNLILAMVVCLAATLGAIATAGPASAAASSCSVNYVCLWGNRSWSGSPWFEKATIGKHNTGWSNNDETSSAWNRKNNMSTLLYDDTNQDSSGGVVCLPRNYASRDLNDEQPEFDDRISSIWIRSEYCGHWDGTIDPIGSKKTS